MQHEAGRQLSVNRAARSEELRPATVAGLLKINLVSDPKENTETI